MPELAVPGPIASGPIAILGNGGWGTAIAILLAGKGVPVRLWGIDEEYVAEVARTRDNQRYLKGFLLPEAVLVTSDFSQATREASLLISAIPTQFLGATFDRFAMQDESGGAPILSLSKGIEVGTLLRPTQILRKRFPRRRLAVLVGPSHAEEVAAGLPAAVVVASSDEALAREIQGAVGTDRFRVYTSSDVVGVEFASAYKNVIALAAGICDGVGFGDNAKAALLTRGMVEMTRLGVALGATRQTFAGLAGIGDIITTCVSPHGRNRAVGERIGRGETLAGILENMEQVAEGVPTTKAVIRIARERQIDLPIAEQVHRVLFHGKSPQKAVTDLMLREPKREVEEYR